MKQVFLLVLMFFTVALGFAQEKPEGLFINSKAFDFRLKDQSGNEVSLRDLRKKGNVVVLFYRGFWCPYCSKELRRFQDSLQLITAKGAQIVAITPENRMAIDSTVSKTGAKFPILYDSLAQVAKKYEVAYTVDETTYGRYKNAGFDLLKINDQKKEATLPVPAVYIVNKDGSVTFRYFNADYRRRVSVKEILDNLK